MYIHECMIIIDYIEREMRIIDYVYIYDHTSCVYISIYDCI